MFLILGALRRFNTSMTSLRAGIWRGYTAPPLGHDPEGKTLGILGMGGIGRNLRKKAAAFDMKIVYHNRRRLSEEMAGGAKYVGFEELLRGSDVISLNLPLNVSIMRFTPSPHVTPRQSNTHQKETRHKISTAELALMKPGVVIVNTARGAVIDEAALVEALDSGHVASVGLDVYEDEPAVHPGLLANPHVILMPHMGTWTVEVSYIIVSLNAIVVRCPL
jgi:glyoxylate reductase